MKLPVIATILLLATTSDTFASSRPEMSKTALAKTCEFANTLLTSSKAVAEKFYEMAHLFPVDKRTSLKSVLELQLKPMKFVAFDVYHIGDLNGLLVENLIVAQTTDQSSLFIRLSFEPFDDISQLYHFHLQGDIDKLRVQTFIQKPVLASCT